MYSPPSPHAIQRVCLAIACAFGALSAGPAMAADDATLTQLRQQIQDMREQYEARLRALEDKIQQAQASPPAARATDAMASTPPAAARNNSFNPSIAVILSGTYANLSRDPDTWAMTGFHLGDGEVGPGSKGLSLGESEVTLSANIDPWWYGALTVAFTPENEVGVEEAFVQTTALSDGLKVKAGRFLSGVGYLNEQHAHTWDFVDAPLAYQAFLGGQRQQDGVQAKWLLPTEQFMELGAEIGRGGATHNGAGSAALMAHIGGDVGASHTWRAGLSHLWTNPEERSWQDSNDATNTLNGHSRTWVLDGVWKWAPNGNATRTNLKLQGEYFNRHEQGSATASATDNTDAYSTAQSGWYLQAIYQFQPGWRVGLRQDQLNTGRVDYASNNADIERPDARPRRTSVMLDWSLSEFSRWRVQLNDDRARQGVTDTQFYLQYQMSLGAHGAHGY